MQNLKTVDFGVAFTLTRPAPADYEDKDGNTQTAAANEPRFNYSNGVAQGLLLDASLSETAAIDDVPVFNASVGHWIIDATFDDSEPLKGIGLDERFSGSGKMVVSYSGGTAKVWAGGQAIYTVASYTPAEPTHICEGGMATIGGLTYKPSAISDADAAALATGDFVVYRYSPAELFESGEEGAWYDPSDLTTLFQDAAGTIPVTADGDPVGLMLDKSGNGNHATQSTTAAKPVYRTDGTLHWLKFDGIDDGMESPTVNTSGAGLLFAYAGLVDTGTSRSDYGPLDTGGNRNGYTLYNSGGSGNTRVFLNSSGRTFSEAVAGVSLVHSWRTDNDASLYSLRANGAEKAGAIGTSDTQINGSISVGRTFLAGSATPWSMYGLVVRGGKTDDSENGSLEVYLAEKSGVVL
tara:strand:- start:866 stop:2089 length:1224 start_codon:yes stop_codon:yes gene_type:complete